MNGQDDGDDLRHFFETSLDLLCIANFKGYFTRVNPAWETTFGFTPEEVKARPFLEFVHPDDLASTAAEAQKLSEGATTIWFENRYRCKDGGYRSLMWRASPDTERKRIYCYARDVTEQKQTSEKLRKSEQQLRAVTESASDAIISADSRGIICGWNKGACTHFGYESTEAIGRPLTMLMPERYRESHLKGIEHFISTGFASVIGKTVELHGLRKDGTEFPFELALSTWQASEKTFYAGIIRDITERKRIEQARHSMEERLQAILDNSTAMIFLKDLEGRYMLVNQRWRRLFHLENEEAVGKTDADIFPVEMAQAYRENDMKVLTAGVPMTVEELVPHDDGPHTYLRVKFPLFDAAGMPCALGGIATDITIRKRMEEELRRSNEDLEQFAYVASHDLQEPLRMVTSYLQFLERRYKPKLDGDAVQFIEFAVQGARRMKALIEDLLQYSRVGMRGAALELVESEKIFVASCINLRVAIEESGATITNEPLPVVMGDATQLGQVFQNLLANALKFRGTASPKIHVSARCETSFWTFAVKDNGIGIEQRFFDRIFAIFQRLHTREEYAGTGIGLAVCKKIIERHGGRIWLESKPDAGTTFYFSLPIPSKKRPKI